MKCIKYDKECGNCGIWDAIGCKVARERMKAIDEIHEEAQKRWDEIKTGKETWDEFVKIYGKIKQEVEEEYNKRE